MHARMLTKSYSKPCPPSLLRSPLSLPSPSGCTFWGKKPWSRKKKILWQLGTLVGAPVGIALIAGIAIPAMIIGIPVYVGRKVCSVSHSRSVARALSSPSLFLCSQSVFLFPSPSVFVSLSVSQSPSLFLSVSVALSLSLSFFLSFFLFLSFFSPPFGLLSL